MSRRSPLTTTPPSRFAETIFAQVEAQDLMACPPAIQARLAEAAWQHLLEARPDEGPDVRLTDIDLGTPEEPRPITILEAVNRNRPFLLDSTLGELADGGFEILLVAHPILATRRGRAGRLEGFGGDASVNAPAGMERESLLHIHLARIDDEAAREQLRGNLEAIYAEIAVAVGDWVAMRTRVYEAIQGFRLRPPPLPHAEIAEAAAFLEWLGADNFTFLGIREYRFPGADFTAEPVSGPGLGLLRDPGAHVFRHGSRLVAMTPEIRQFLARPRAMIVTKANVRSRIHRRVHLDYIGVKLFGPAGETVGELRIIGLFAADLYTMHTRDIPYLRRKVADVIARAGFDEASYAGRALRAVLEGYPRDELLQIDRRKLYQFALEILKLSEHPRLRALIRVDRYDRFVSALVFVPKDRYDTQIRHRIGAYLAAVYRGRVSAAYPSYPEGVLARTHFIIGRIEGATPTPTREEIERGIAAIVRTWGDGLREALGPTMDGRRLYARFAEAFSAAYREAFSPEDAKRDIGVIDSLTDAAPRAVALSRRAGDPQAKASLRIFSRTTSLPLSERVPFLEHLGFRVVDERTYRIAAGEAAGTGGVWLYDMSLERLDGGAIEIEAIAGRVERLLMALFAGEAESDTYNRLVLETDLEWRDVALLRGLGRYLRQLQVPFSPDYIAGALVRNAAIAGEIVRLFHARFEPACGNPASPSAETIALDLSGMIEAVPSLDDDRILRRFVNLVQAAVRTNFFQRDSAGRPRPTIALKFACAQVDGMPLPRPLYETFVYSPRVEGVHLRFGRVARGGLRWSDRPQDYRTEVLGLVKAQQVKNAVIVPVGAKGGFVPQHLPPYSDRTAWFAEGLECYRLFVDALLDLTDNIVGDHIVPPERTVRHDPDDPYLVVAADKGTATFSDTANALAGARGFWLGDAFASGGSQGYDHKAMGITARGAWEAVKRHFREMDIDIQTTPFSAVGVGDMSGDVFGNGVLLSRKIRLLAAFDHRHIFLDPAPDPETSWTERARLFRLPRSSWDDYDRRLISQGGGVFPRTAKEIRLSPQVRAALGIAESVASPSDVIRGILRAPVDLLWFGGIGTFIRASDEADGQIGDRANDGVRVTGREVRARVIGEGANLAVSQRGRIEAAARGVRLNTDAIDNSAGVNTSDVEVNIKIALSSAQASGKLGAAERSQMLADMTEEVSRLVLRNNYLQSLAISLAVRRGPADLAIAERAMEAWEHEGRLDRALEYLPDPPAMAARMRDGFPLTRPEIAVLLAYSKLSLHDALLGGTLIDDPYLERELEHYFPEQLRSRFPEAVRGHKLRREIVATAVANAVINRAGPFAVIRLMDETGADSTAVAAAFLAAWNSFALAEVSAEIDGLDGLVSGDVQLALYARVQDLLLGRMVWFLRHGDLGSANLAETIARFGGVVAALSADLGGAGLSEILPPNAIKALEASAQDMATRQVPEPLARRLAGHDWLAAATDIALVAERTQRPVREVAATHFALAERFRMAALQEAAEGIRENGYDERLALDRLLAMITAAHRRLTTQVIMAAGHGGDGVAAWCSMREAEVSRVDAGLERLANSGPSLARLTIAAGLLGDLAAG